VALDYAGREILWQINVSDVIRGYSYVTAEQLKVDDLVSQTSSQVGDGIVHFGTNIHALMVGVDRQNGSAYDVIQINLHPYATLTISPIPFNAKIFIGSSSIEQSAVFNALGYVCCSFVGNFAALRFDSFTSKFSVVFKHQHASRSS